MTSRRPPAWEPLYEATPYRNGVPIPGELPSDTTMWMNHTYVVHCRKIEHDDPQQKPMFHLSIRRQDRGAAKDWRDFQRIKNQLAGPEYEGAELYPPESAKVDTANQYHLWCFPFRLGFGLGDQRMVSNHEVTSAVEPGAVQRDNEEIDGPLNDSDDLTTWSRRSKLMSKKHSPATEAAGGPA